ncbi:PH domain-containing protein [Micromonospora aurantiaca (nom. illeg.)]|uniref:PH domain-containing protein n=1 Tax=Micromonospora aurantiaca (nom. illeg.) TaxID=47850 RepID=UPI00223B5951|nr:PH domain-containing protein [Micromonospora aurantiaca]
MSTPATPGHHDPAGEEVTVRPRRIRQISIGAAAVILAINLYAGLTLSGTTSNGGRLFPADRWAVIGVGVLFTALALLPWRLRVQADRERVRVRNLVGDVTVPWEVVERVRFDRNAVWASLDLINGDVVPLLSVQVIDHEDAVAAVRRLRALLAAARAKNLHRVSSPAPLGQDRPAVEGTSTAARD